MYLARKSNSVTFIGLFTIIVGVIGILGWVYDIPLLKKVFPNYVAMKFNTAIAVLFVGIMLLIAQFKSNKIISGIITVIALLTVTIGAVSLLQDIMNADWGLDQLFVPDKEATANHEVFPGRMAANSALCFILFGSAFLFRKTNKSFLIEGAQYLLHLITAISAIALVGYVYNLSLFYNFSHIGPMAFQTALALFISSIAAARLNPSVGIAGLFTGDQIGNQMAKRLFVLLVVVVITFGSISLQNKHYYIFSFELGFAMLTVGFIIINLFVIWYTAYWLNGIDLKRNQAEQALKALNEELERRVDERTADLTEIFKKFRESESKFRTLVEKSLVGVYISQNERFNYVNPRLAEIFGYEPQELINTAQSPIEILISQNDRDMVRRKIQERYNGETEMDHYEVVGIKKDGSPNRVEFYGTGIVLDGIPTIIGTMLDITQRAKADEILKRSEANLKTIMDTTDTIYVLLDKKLDVMAFNPVAEKFLNEQFNLSVENIDPTHTPFPKEGFPQFLLDRIDQFRSERLKTFVINANKVLEGEELIYEIDYLQRSGEVRWYDVRLSPIKNNDKEIFGLLMELNDITERKKADDNLKIAYARIQEHVRSIEEIAWKQSHVLRGPIANLKALAVLLVEDRSDEKALGFIQSELERLDNVLKDMATTASDSLDLL
jgi:PAS domain S-box-containing protein